MRPLGLSSTCVDRVGGRTREHSGPRAASADRRRHHTRRDGLRRRRPRGLSLKFALPQAGCRAAAEQVECSVPGLAGHPWQEHDQRPSLSGIVLHMEPLISLVASCRFAERDSRAPATCWRPGWWCSHSFTRCLHQASSANTTCPGLVCPSFSFARSARCGKHSRQFELTTGDRLARLLTGRSLGFARPWIRREPGLNLLESAVHAPAGTCSTPQPSPPSVCRSMSRGLCHSIVCKVA